MFHFIPTFSAFLLLSYFFNIRVLIFLLFHMAVLDSSVLWLPSDFCTSGVMSLCNVFISHCLVVPDLSAMIIPDN